MSEPVVLGLLGLGTIGGGVWQALAGQSDLLAERVGRAVVVGKALVRDLAKPHPGVPPDLLTTDPREVVGDPRIGIVVEVLGGEHPAYELVKQALLSGQHVVTANKELLAKHGAELFALARERGLELACEASVGGGIPIIAAIRKSLVANRVSRVRGIVNGTTNYILTEMVEKGRDFAAVLAEAQALGYAEPDPTNDVEGFDARYKLCVLSGLAFAAWPQPEDVPCQGITRLTAADLRFAGQFGYAVKLLATVRPLAGAVEAGVEPTLVPLTSPLAVVNGVFNAVQVQGDLVGDTLFYGRGAGPAPTTSAILGDVVAVARGERSPLPLAGTVVRAVPATATHYYLRLAPAEDARGLLHDAGLEILGHRAAGGAEAFLVRAAEPTAWPATQRRLSATGRLAATLPVAP
ncbi:MAG: homoserine dehydrogenase [Chloroflexi bacterium]|nr:homoserine dehydrogenase [Chloroflexota bacterium]MCL5110320.1 homoserine dehydrogenase [Chloroflexota bacterium]